MATQTPPRTPVTQPRLGPVGWARWAWRSLTSMRTALFLLLLLSIAAVPGSIFPQRSIDAGKVADFIASNPTTGPWLDRLGFFEVYSSVWFSAIYLLLVISLVGCIVPRSRLHWHTLRAKPPRAPRNLSRLDQHVELSYAGDVALRAVGCRGSVAGQAISGGLPRRRVGERRERVPARDRQPGLPHRPLRRHHRRRGRAPLRVARRRHPHRGRHVLVDAVVLRLVPARTDDRPGEAAAVHHRPEVDERHLRGPGGRRPVRRAPELHGGRHDDRAAGRPVDAVARSARTTRSPSTVPTSSSSATATRRW